MFVDSDLKYIITVDNYCALVINAILSAISEHLRFARAHHIDIGYERVVVYPSLVWFKFLGSRYSGMRLMTAKSKSLLDIKHVLILKQPGYLQEQQIDDTSISFTNEFRFAIALMFWCI